MRFGGVIAMAMLIGALTVSVSPALHAQGVYVTQGDNGPVFSDKPQSGAKEVRLRPLSVIPSEQMTPAAPPSSRASVAPAPSYAPRSAAPVANDGRRGEIAGPYSAFMILSPPEGGSVIANTGSFEVRLGVEPPLMLGEGHSIVLWINGREVMQRFTATEIMIPPEFWGGALPPVNQQAQLDASIVDHSGQVLMQATPVRFVMRYTTVLNRPHPLAPAIRPIQPMPPMVPVQPVRPIMPAPAKPAAAIGATSGPAIGATTGPAIGAASGTSTGASSGAASSSSPSAATPRKPRINER